MSILLISPSKVYATKRFKQEAALLGLPITHFDAHDLAKLNFNIDIKSFDLLYVRQAYPYLPEVINFANKFKQFGKVVIDESIAGGDLGLGKMDAYQRLLQSNIQIPRTEWLSDNNKKEIIFPAIVKWTYGFAGREVFVVNNENRIWNIEKRYPKDELLLQELIFSVKEYKVVTVGYRSLPVVLRFETNPKTFRPNFSTAETVPSQQVSHITKFAEQAARVLGRELAKVDIVETADHRLYVLEVNRFPGLKSFEQLTGYNAAKHFMEYIKSWSLAKHKGLQYNAVTINQRVGS